MKIFWMTFLLILAQPSGADDWMAPPRPGSPPPPQWVAGQALPPVPRAPEYRVPVSPPVAIVVPQWAPIPPVCNCDPWAGYRQPSGPRGPLFGPNP